MKVAVIGPLAPFHSGIARHTTALARELAGRPEIELRAFSFARQYPRWLFPGQCQTNLEAQPPAGLEVRRPIDTLNPASWGRTAREVLDFAPDLAIVPAWTFFVAPALGAIAGALRKAGVQVAMLVHNAADHERARWKQLLLDRQLRHASRFITHNHAVAGAVRAAMPDTPVNVSPHPLYDDYPEALGLLPRRAPLELLFFGLVRPYKGLETLLHGFARSGRSDARLSVVGEFWSGLDETRALIERLGIAEQVELVPRFVTDREAAEYFARCDALVAPYHAASGSGVVALAQHYGRPVIASDLPALGEAVVPGRTGWLFPAGDAHALAHLLETTVSRRAATALRPGLDALRDELSWVRLADEILEVRSSQKP